MRKGRERIKGISVAIVLLTIAMIMVVGFSIAVVSSQNQRNVRSEYVETKLFYAAESGMARAFRRLRNDETWNGFEDPPTNKKRTFNRVAIPSDDNFTYTVYVYNNIDGSSDIPAIQGIVVPPGNCYVVTESSFADSNGGRLSKKVGGMLRKTSVFDFGIFAKNKLLFRGNTLVDAYDSAEGAYSVKTKVNKEADVGTNNNKTASIVIAGRSNSIDGDVVSGPNSYPGKTILVRPSTWKPGGYFKTLISTLDFPEVELPASAVKASPLPAAPEEEGPSKGGGKSGSSIELLPGYYTGIKKSDRDTYVLKNYGTLENPSVYVFDSINLSGGSIIEMDNSNGPVHVYVNGDVELRGNSGISSNVKHSSSSVNPSPGDLQFLVTANGKEVDMAGSSDAFFAMYAPDSEVRIHGNSDVFGSVIGDYVQFMGNPDFHYDVQLKKQMDVYVYKVGSYQRF